MTGILHPVASQSEYVAGRPWNVNYKGNPSSCLLSFTPSGDITRSGSGASIGTDGAARWYTSPPTYTPFIRATVTAGALTGGTAAGSWTPISGAPSFGQTSGSTPASATVTFEMSPSASGTPIVWTSTGNVLARSQ